MAKKRITDQQILDAHRWYLEDNLRTLGQAASPLGLTSPALVYHFHRLGLKVKPRGGKREKFGQRITLYCEVCQEPFEMLVTRYKERLSRGPIKYCSPKCMGIANSYGEVLVTCANCGCEFLRRIAQLKEDNFCSPKCATVKRTPRTGPRKPYAKWNDKAYIKTYHKEYQTKNQDRLNAQRRAYGNAHKAQKLINQKRYRQTHKDYIAFVSRVRKQRIYSAEFDQQEWDAMKAKYNYTCLSCKRQEPEIKLTMDHVIPLALGGEHHLSNVQPLCKSCNSVKGTKCTDYR